MKNQLINIVAVVFLCTVAAGNAWSAEPVAKKQPVKSQAKTALKPFVGIDAITGMEFVLVKGRCYQMGDVSGVGREDEKPAHEVCVSDYYLGKFEVTQAQWQKIMGTNPSYYKQCGLDCPVESVGWNDVQKFIAEMNSKSSRKFRLPTEAEWEYAARSGGKQDLWSGTSDEASLGEFAWYNNNADGITHTVGLKKANALGVYDMSGNVIEWCQDWYGEAHYKESARQDPFGPAKGEKRILRGGSFDDDAGRMRGTFRNSDPPGSGGGSGYGFRLVHPVK